MICLSEECFIDLFICCPQRVKPLHRILPLHCLEKKGEVYSLKMTLKLMAECLEQNASGFMLLKLTAKL